MRKVLHPELERSRCFLNYWQIERIKDLLGGGIKCHFLFMKEKFDLKYEEIISLDNLFAAWEGFARGKRSNRDVQEFGFCLVDNIL
jgi:hypothetical protein